jgi:hypothetical protein
MALLHRYFRQVAHFSTSVCRRKAEVERQPRPGAISQLLALIGFFADRMVGRTSRGNQPVILGV